jgi:hypothetical protein
MEIAEGCFRWVTLFLCSFSCLNFKDLIK